MDLDDTFAGLTGLPARFIGGGKRVPVSELRREAEGEDVFDFGNDVVFGENANPLNLSRSVAWLEGFELTALPLMGC